MKSGASARRHDVVDWLVFSGAALVCLDGSMDAGRSAMAVAGWLEARRTVVITIGHVPIARHNAEASQGKLPIDPHLSTSETQCYHCEHKVFGVLSTSTRIPG
jgi:hypothetical protein